MHNSDALTAMFGGCLIFVLLIIAVGIAIAVFYLLTMQKALTLAGERHQKMSPGLVWLMFIPLFNLVWHFFVVKNVSESIKSWAAENGQNVNDAGYTVGLVGCICNCLCIIPFINVLAGPAALICYIIWWVKVASFNKLMAGQA